MKTPAFNIRWEKVPSVCRNRKYFFVTQHPIRLWVTEGFDGKWHLDGMSGNIGKFATADEAKAHAHVYIADQAKIEAELCEVEL